MISSSPWSVPRSDNPLPDDGSVPAYMWHQWPDPALTMIQYQEEGQSSTDAAIVYPDAYKTADPILVNQ